MEDINKEQRGRLFKSKMILFGDNTLDSLAEYLGIVRQTLARKIDGETDFSQTEMSLIKIRYHLTDAEFVQLFMKELKRDEYSGSSEVAK